MRCAIVHYHELALKGRNREYFEERLVRNIQWMLRDLGVRRVENLRSRIRVVLPDQVPDQAIIERLTRVFGIANFSLAHGLPLDMLHPDIDALSKAVQFALVGFIVAAVICLIVDAPVNLGILAAISITRAFWVGSTLAPA